MRLAPRQLQRAGITGAVPYYGGRLTPAQAYAVSHQGGAAASADQQSTAPRTGELTEKLATLQQLLDDGVITDDEYSTLRARVLK